MPPFPKQFLPGCQNNAGSNGKEESIKDLNLESYHTYLSENATNLKASTDSKVLAFYGFTIGKKFLHPRIFRFWQANIRH